MSCALPGPLSPCSSVRRHGTLTTLPRVKAEAPEAAAPTLLLDASGRGEGEEHRIGTGQS